MILSKFKDKESLKRSKINCLITYKRSLIRLSTNRDLAGKMEMGLYIQNGEI